MGCSGCQSCGTALNNMSSRCSGKCTGNKIQVQKRIWNQIRVPSSLYLTNISALQIGTSRLTASSSTFKNNQSSDQATASVQVYANPTHGNSTKCTLTRLRPGAGNAGGTGVDVKHNSYARYLGRKKAGNLKTQKPTTLTPLYGNKTEMNGLITRSENCCPS